MIKLVNVIIHSNLRQFLVHSIRKMTHQVFVYGTLKRNEPNHHWLTKEENGVSKFIAKGKTKTKYPLIIATKYNIPFLLHSPGNGNNVEGEVYEVDNIMLCNLDILEDHPNYYIREKDDIVIQTGENCYTIKCWVYFLKDFKPELMKKPLLSSYSSSGPHGLVYMKRCKRDPNYDYRTEVKDKKGKTKKIKTNTDDFQITNSTWKLMNKQKANTEEEQYADYFVKKATLTNGGVKMEKVVETDSESEDEKKDVLKMTDEELFAACGGRTAHKGARHGLRALGKLARIEQQEQSLLEQTKYEGYSHHTKKKKHKINPANELPVEDLNLNSDADIPKTKKKKKKKRCSNNASLTEIGNGDIEVAELVEPEAKKNKKKRKLTDENVANAIVEGDSRKSKKSKCVNENPSSPDVGCLSKSKKKKKHNENMQANSNEAESTNFLKTGDKYEFLETGVVRKTKKKNKKDKSQ